MPFWHEANYIVFRASHFFSLSPSTTIPHHAITDTQTSQPEVTGSESSRRMGFSSDTSPNGTLQESRHQLVHSDTANAATKHMTQDAHLKIDCKTRSSNNKKQYAIECEYIDTFGNGCQINV